MLTLQFKVWLHYLVYEEIRVHLPLPHIKAIWTCRPDIDSPPYVPLWKQWVVVTTSFFLVCATFWSLSPPSLCPGFCHLSTTPPIFSSLYHCCSSLSSSLLFFLVAQHNCCLAINVHVHQQLGQAADLTLCEHPKCHLQCTCAQMHIHIR